MGRGQKRDKRPYVRPVQKVELSDKKVVLRIVLSVICVFIAAAMFAYGMVSCLSKGSGWREISVNSSAEIPCASEFVFRYELGASGMAATAEYKKLSAEYSRAMLEASRMFSESFVLEGLNNLAYLNANANKTVKVEKELYSALEMLEKYSCREHYLAPVMEYYNTMFNCEYDSDAVNFDPQKNSEAKEYISELCRFAQDSEKTEIRLFDDCRVMLYVSADYLEFARENGIDTFVDLGWMKNAFIADYVADELTEQNYTRGILSSYDGFVRNMYSYEGLFSFNIFDRINTDVYKAATFEYSGTVSIVCMRDHPINSLDILHYYKYENGDIRHPYIDVNDGICKNSVSTLTSYSSEYGCAEIMLEMMKLYISDSFDRSAPETMKEKGVQSIWCESGKIYYTDKNAILSDLYSDGETDYIKELY